MASSPQQVDDRRVVGDHRRRGQGQPGGRPDHDASANVEHDRSGRHPADGRRLGRHLRRQRLDPDEPARRRQGSDQLTVELKDGREFTGTVYGIDTLTDLAIVKVDATGLPAAPIGNSSTSRSASSTIAIGSPLGTYTNTVTSGIVSATGRAIDVDSGADSTTCIQTDAAINPGNSGGPLLDAGGNVIGINTAVAANANGIGFAIPINIARPIMDQALAGQKLARPYIGIRYETIDLQRSKEHGLPVDEGALVDGGQSGPAARAAAIVPDGPADKAGVKEGDIIVAIEGQTIDTEHPLDCRPHPVRAGPDGDPGHPPQRPEARRAGHAWSPPADL